MYDYLIIGSGLFGATFAHQATLKGKKCLVIDKRSHVGGNLYCDKVGDIFIHSYGPHIFHTNDEAIWKYVNGLTRFNPYIYQPMSSYKEQLYNLPFNMNTFYRLWKTQNPDEVQQIIKSQSAEIKTVFNLEDKCISLIGRQLYEMLVKGYTEKQWGRSCRSLPAFIISRLPVRLTFDNNYFDDTYQGIPAGSYNDLIAAMLSGSIVKTNTDYFADRDHFHRVAKKIVYTGPIDQLFDYRFGYLEYRSLSFTTKQIEMDNFQGAAVINYADAEIPYTRSIEHKHFNKTICPYTVISYEYPEQWHPGKEPFYPINDNDNNARYKKYRDYAAEQKKFIIGGRLGSYKYYNMDQVIGAALKTFRSIEME